jgi:Tannase and feruloyl esterase
MRILVGGLCALVLAAVMTPQPLAAAASCESLASMALPNATITLARTVEAGPFTPDAGGDEAAQAQKPLNIPRAFCRVAATLKPSNDSDIKVEIWLPSENWNGKFQAVGNGAFSGSIAYPAMLAALARGYATASTDTGHAGNTASFALGHPEKIVDFGWRSVHEMAVASKKILASYYDAALRFSYWTGCSAGGRQALKEAQRFPADFDGIVAGAPGLDWTGRAAQAVYVAQALQKDESARLSSAKAQLVHNAVLAACDARDGVKDGVVDDPKTCSFNPAMLQCKGADDGSCLTPAQVNTVRMLYSPQVNGATKRAIPGLLPGSELGWTDLGWTASARATGLDQFRYIVFKDASWDISKFNAATDFARAEEADDNTLNALDPNLKPFIARGGKMIQYHGWSDPQISPEASVQYYQRVLAALGGANNVRGSYRLFMAPGMGHCGGGNGPNTFDMVTALEQWVEQGKAPDQIVASRSVKGVVDRTRPLCPYPQVAVYKGSGSTDEAANFACQVR